MSDGAEIRLALNILPAAVFLLFRSRFNIPPHLRSFWIWWAISVLCLIPLMYIASKYSSTTVVDRLNLYLTPIQIFVTAHLPTIFKGAKQRVFITTVILILYGFSHFFGSNMQDFLIIGFLIIFILLSILGFFHQDLQKYQCE